MESIGIKFPFSETEQGGIINVVKTDIDKIKSNLTSFFTTKRYQRVMHNDFYSPLYDYIMEQWDEITENELSEDINRAMERFFPEVSLKDIEYYFDESTYVLDIKLKYVISDLNYEDAMTISLSFGQ